MHAISPEELDCERPGSPHQFTSRVYLLLMFGGTLVMALAVLSDMQPRLTLAAALWTVSGFYGMAQLLRRDRRPEPAAASLASAAPVGIVAGVLIHLGLWYGLR